MLLQIQTTHGGMVSRSHCYYIMHNFLVGINGINDDEYELQIVMDKDEYFMYLYRAQCI